MRAKSFLFAVTASFTLVAAALFATQPSHNYSSRTVSQLLDLLENKDVTVRQCAAIFLGDRYRNPNAAVVNGPIHATNTPPAEFPIPALVVPRLAAHLKSDPDMSVRICAVFALRDLRFYTNTTVILSASLDDKNDIVKIRTCTALVEIAHDYSEPLQPKIIPTLIDCLDSKAEVEQLWQAAYAAEALGSNGSAVIPALQKLTKHNAPKVRHYAENAISKIEAAAKK